MHDINIKMIKITLIIVIIAVVFSMVESITLLKNNYYWRSQYFLMQWDYLKTEVMFAEHSNGGILNSIFSKKQAALTISNMDKAQSVPILLYHGVINNPKWKPDGVSISLADFREQMFALKTAGYQTVKIEDYLAFSRGQKDLPRKSFVLTFDDGRNDSYYPVDPIIRTLGYTAIMNVITGRSLALEKEKSSFHLSQDELSKMLESGRWEMASHTQNGHGYVKIDSNEKDGHFLSNKLWLNDKNRLETDDEYKKRIYNDLLASKNDLEKKLGVKALAFAYPFGDFGQVSDNFPESRNIIIDTAKSIFSLSFAQAGSSDFLTNYAENSFIAKRINVDSSISAAQLLAMLKNTETKPIDFQDDFSQDKGWIRGWGASNIGKGGMTISDSQEEDSGLVFLSGSYLWKDYFTEARAVLLKGHAFALSARYEDENNYVSCDFSDSHVALTQRLAGKDLPDVEVPPPANLNIGREALVGIQVSGNQGSCFLDGKPVVSGPLESDLNHGGISIKIWDTIEKGSTLLVKNLRVSRDHLSLFK